MPNWLRRQGDHELPSAEINGELLVLKEIPAVAAEEQNDAAVPRAWIVADTDGVQAFDQIAAFAFPGYRAFEEMKHIDLIAEEASEIRIIERNLRRELNIALADGYGLFGKTDRIDDACRREVYEGTYPAAIGIDMNEHLGEASRGFNLTLRLCRHRFDGNELNVDQTAIPARPFAQPGIFAGYALRDSHFVGSERIKGHWRGHRRRHWRSLLRHGQNRDQNQEHRDPQSSSHKSLLH